MCVYIYIYLHILLDEFLGIKMLAQSTCGFSNLNKGDHVHCSQPCKRGPVSPYSYQQIALSVLSDYCQSEG